MNNFVNGIPYILIGIGIGTVVTSYIWNRKYNAFAVSEGEWCNKLVNNLKQDMRLETSPKNEVECNTDKKMIDYSKMASIYRINNLKQDMRLETSHRSSDNYLKDIYVINFEEFCDGFPNNSKVSLTYYTETDILMDERDQKIEDRNRIIGDEALSKFGFGSDDPDVVYVRNNKSAIDYEIVRVYSTCSCED